jgi:predicted ATP-dependent protease
MTLAMDSSDLLYGDLDALSSSNELEKLRKDAADYAAKVVSLETELKEVQEHNVAVMADKVNLEKNIVSLYNTAMAEIARKDRELTELKALVDKASFKG